MHRTALIAIGGNSLIRAGEAGSLADQRARAQGIARGIASLMKDGVRVLLTHGNGPQVGAALLRSEQTANQVYGMSLDVCVAATQGEIGYLLQHSLEQELLRQGLRRPVTTILTQAVVAGDDPAFQRPAKPVGPFYSKAAAAERMREDGWTMVEEPSRGYRRVVPSPEPLEIVEEESIRACWEQGHVVIAAGGGGIPVIRRGGDLSAVEAVIDKDLSSVLLAGRLSIDLLVFATDIEFVYLDYGRPGQRPLERVLAPEMEIHLQQGQFPEGTMGPKIRAALRFLRDSGKEAVITSLERLPAALRGNGGTHILPIGPEEELREDRETPVLTRE